MAVPEKYCYSPVPQPMVQGVLIMVVLLIETGWGGVGWGADLRPYLLKMNYVLKIALIKIFKWNVGVHFVSYLVYFTRFRCAENCIPNTSLSIWCCAITLIRLKNQKPAILQWMSLYTSDGQPFYHRGPKIFLCVCVSRTHDSSNGTHNIHPHNFFSSRGLGTAQAVGCSPLLYTYVITNKVYHLKDTMTATNLPL